MSQSIDESTSPDLLERRSLEILCISVGILAASDLPPLVLVHELANMPVEVAEDGTSIHYEDSPGIDRIRLLQLATVLSDMDPDVLEYHAGGRGEEYLEGFNLDDILSCIDCPLLPLQANPAKGGMLTDQVVDLVLSKVPTAMHVRLDTAGHDLGLDTWQVASLLRSINAFLEAV